jgi:HPt (histidine-containing phosphotransfer) domain-containing protein
VKLTSNGQRTAGAVAMQGDSFEELRATFLERLKAERQRLVSLGAALAQRKTSRAPVLDELRSRAHRLSGSAAIFELSGVAALARALELAVDAMTVVDRLAVPRAENSDRVMRAALQALIQVIDSFNKPSHELALHEPMPNSNQARRILNG